MCDIAYTATFWANYTLQPSLFTPDQLLETLLIRNFLYQDFRSSLKIHFILNGNMVSVMWAELHTAAVCSAA